MWIFNKKNKENTDKDILRTLVEYIEQLRLKYKSDKDIVDKLLEMGIKENVIRNAFQLVKQRIPLKKVERRDSMAKKEEEQEDDEEELEEDDEEELEEVEEEDEAEEPKPKKIFKKQDSVKVEKKPVEDLDNTLNKILNNFDARLSNIESRLFRAGI